MNKSKDRKVAILLAVYNGADFLEEQLNSLAMQDHPSIDIWLSDDGSNDATLEIAKKFQKTWKLGRFTILTNQHQFERKQMDEYSAFQLLAKSNDNFRSLIMNENIEADFYAFCDQDDIWAPTKLSHAIKWLSSQPESDCNLHCSRTCIIDSDGEEKGKSMFFETPPSFRNAIIQNIVSGNTIVMNKTSMAAMRRFSKKVDFVSHDWWTYIVISALQGNIRYDALPLTLYRQHDANLVGENASWRARMTRFRLVLAGRFKYWNDVNTKALTVIRDELPMETIKILDDFTELRMKQFYKRPFLLIRSGIHRQTLAGQVTLLVALIFGKI